MIEADVILERIKEKKPLVHHLTNWVTIYDCANITRMTGALPVMAHAPEEVAQMTGIASALVLNIGTLTKDFIDAMIIAGKAANEKGIPIVLDAVGAGATDLRTEESKRLLKELKIDIIKGNAGEVGVLAGVEAEVKGVESMSVDGEPSEIAASLAKAAGATVVITGKQDIVSNDEKTYKVNNGHELMGSVVGTGCMAASVIGSFAAVEADYAKAAASALACYGIAGEIAAQNAKGPGTFKENFFDALYNLSSEEIKSKIKVDES
jgi:hydroxyethylthiazole kinase